MKEPANIKLVLMVGLHPPTAQFHVGLAKRRLASSARPVFGRRPLVGNADASAGNGPGADWHHAQLAMRRFGTLE